MLTIDLEGILHPSVGVKTKTLVQRSPVTLDALQTLVLNVLPVAEEGIYFIHNGKRLEGNSVVAEGIVRAVPRLPGGKGGFGSMLRAIGAQIEKTTNREACRDLSGRRLRDINEEQRLKNWINKKADREREAIERKQKKLDKLRSEPKIEFKDKKYEEERSKMTDVVHDAVEKGFQASTSKPSSSTSCSKPVKRKGFMLEEEEFSGDSSISSSDESESENALKRKAETKSDSDSPSPAKRQNREEIQQSGGQTSTSSDESSSDEKREDKV